MNLKLTGASGVVVSTDRSDGTITGCGKVEVDVLRGQGERTHLLVRGPGFVMDWAGWAIFGLIATAGLTVILTGSQMLGWTRLDLPLMLGTLFTADPDRARVIGFFVHLVNGQAFALGYAVAFAAAGSSSWWGGGLLGVVHGFVALMVIIPLLPGVNPRMASSRAGRSTGAALEPPGLLALNYGRETPIVTLLAHVAYGVALGVLLQPS
jgi:hypothetical protein